METQPHSLLIVGLPEAGKTSYIQAVDELLQNPPGADALRSYGLARDRTYLERDKEKFRAGTPLARTERVIKHAPPELLFEDPRTGRRGRLFLPDLRGDIFLDQWSDRRWPESYRDDLKSINGALLFVRADTPSSNQELLGKMIGPPANRKMVPWDPRKASPQVQIVDVLQFIAVRGGPPAPLKMAVMISAWDTVCKPANLQPKTPSRFLAREWALVDQFLRTNAAVFETRVYGVSALGGTKDELKDLSRLPPQDRVSLVDGAETSRDLTRPLRWLLGLQ